LRNSPLLGHRSLAPRQVDAEFLAHHFLARRQFCGLGPLRFEDDGRQTPQVRARLLDGAPVRSIPAGL
jgi:hypothetical protein